MIAENKYHAWSAEDDDEIRARSAEGALDREIGAAIGRTKNSVKQRRIALGIAKRRGRPTKPGREAVSDPVRRRKPAAAITRSVADVVGPAVSLPDTSSMRITPKSVAADIAGLEGQLADLQETLGLLYALQRKLSGENVSLRVVKMARPDPAQDRQTAKLRALKYLREDAV